MAGEQTRKIAELRERLRHLRDSLDVESKTRRLGELEAEMGRSDFWSVPETAQRTVEALKSLKGVVEPTRELTRVLDDAEVLLEMGEEAGDAATVEESVRALAGAEKKLEHLELAALLSGPSDDRNCYMTIHAGAGGTDACDWVEMLLRMYTLWLERSGYATTLLETQRGDEAGLRRAALEIRGDHAFGYLKSEIGVHRLVRISPFDANKRRHTAFASVDLTPEFEEVKIQVNEADLRVDTYRSSGAGGQHVNVTDSAVRITHLPSGIVVACQNERSQTRNREIAMRLLKSKLTQRAEDERDREVRKAYGEKGDIAFGSQIRSYVLQPYQMIKDHRTDLETSNVNEVLDGGLDELIQAFLKFSTKAKK
ncbi:MAG: peptide chain release factor 2 [Planctomycetes bacterium]|nr:peptide chain release factor 2 [Planctomycetota bacterium]